MSEYEVSSLSRLPSLLTAVDNDVTNLWNLVLIAMYPLSSKSFVCPSISLCLMAKLTGNTFMEYMLLAYHSICSFVYFSYSSEELSLANKQTERQRSISNKAPEFCCRFIHAIAISMIADAIKEFFGSFSDFNLVTFKFTPKCFLRG